MRSIMWLMVTVSWLLSTASMPLEAQVAPPPVNDLNKATELRGAREAILGQERAKLQALAVRLRGEGQPVEADQALADAAGEQAADGSSRFLLLPELVASRPKTSPTERDAIRLEAAKALFDLAGKAAQPPEFYALADDCLRQVIHRQPDHPEARRLLGFLPYQGGWATPFAIGMLTRKNVKDPIYGWVAADWIPHLQRGELPARGAPTRWVTADEANAARRNWATRWEIATEHFRIATNVPMNQAISFGQKLEDLHQLFFSMMADVISDDRLPLALRFKKRPVATSKTVFRVCYFATRDEYATYLAPYQGEAGRINLGTYAPRKDSKEFGGVSYFFNDINGQLDVTATLYHEASHQLLFETAGSDDYGRNNGNFWVFEGLGTYFETLQHDPDGNLRIGGLIGPRIKEARRRLIENQEFLPISDLVGYSKPQFWGENGGGNIFRNYAESMALAVFLMQSAHEHYREAFLEYVRDAYKGRFRGASGRPLDDRLEVPYARLDREFLDYLRGSGKPQN